MSEWRKRKSVHHALVVVLLVFASLLAAYGLSATLRWQRSMALLPPSFYWPLALLMLLATITAAAALTSRIGAWRRGEWQEHSLAPFRAGLYSFVLGWALYLVLFHPFNPSVFLLYWGVAGAVFAACITWGERLARRLPSAALRTADLLLFNLCLGLLLAELALRMVAHAFPQPLLSLPGSSLNLIEQNRCRPGSLRFRFPCNSRGYYDEELQRNSNRRLLAAVGDSFSVGVVPHHFNYTTVTERLLKNVDVDIIGIPSIGPSEYIHLLRHEVVPAEPDAILIGLFLGNDLIEAWPRGGYKSISRRLRLWFERSNVLLWVFPQRLYRLLREQWSRGGVGPVGGIIGESGGDGVETDPDELARGFPWLRDPLQERPTFSPEGFLLIERDRIRANCRPAERENYRRAFQSLLEIRRTAEGIPLLFLLIPDEFQVEDGLWEELASKESMPLQRDLPQRLVGDWLDQQGIPYLDLLPVFRSVQPMPDGKRHLYHLRNTHLNARGNQVAGEALAEFLRGVLKWGAGSGD